MKAVHVLVRRYQLEKLLRIEVSGQWKLEQYPVNVIISIQIPDQTFQNVIGNSCRQTVCLGADADLPAVFFLVADINPRSRIISRQDYGQSRRTSSFREEISDLLF
jgi:hypothetical protein